MNGGALAGVVGTIYLGTPWGAGAFIVGNGLCGGAFSALTGIAWPRFFGRRWLGAISGVGMSTMVLASGLGPLAFSLSLSLTKGYAAILWVSAVLPGLLIVGSFFTDNPQRRDEGPPVEKA
jgi:OFA family oxalate/formate antiporter-like MFS transporter